MSRYRKPDVLWSDDLDGRMMDEISEGRSFTQTARTLGLSPAQVSGRFKRLREAFGRQGD